jgi:L-amino acid N-acyltransferase YncA
MNFTARPAHPGDTKAIAAIYNEGIEDRVATFETEPRTPEQIAKWFEGQHQHPIVVVEDEEGAIVAFAYTSGYRSRSCYAGIAEFSIYVAREERRSGVGFVAMASLMNAAADAGFWKLLSRIFPENTASRSLMARLGFREVGIYRRHAKLDGEWRDCVIVERLLGDAAD